MDWSWKHTAAVIGFIAVFAAVSVLATLGHLSEHNHLGFWATAFLLVLLLLLMLVVGHGISGRVDGVFIDSRNRVTLANFQLAVWTLVVLASLGGAFLTNLLANQNGVDALNVSVPPELWPALGISATSFVGAKGLNSLQGFCKPTRLLPIRLLPWPETRSGH